MAGRPSAQIRETYPQGEQALLGNVPEPGGQQSELPSQR